MIFFVELIKTIIYQMFPILIYPLIEKKENINLIVLSSNILLIFFTKNSYFFILSNINLLPLYLKNSNKNYLLLNILNLIYFSKLGIPLLLVLLNIFLIFITLTLSKNKEKNFMLINTYLYTFIILYINQIELISKNTIKIIIILLLNVILTKIIKYIIIDYKSVKYEK